MQIGWLLFVILVLATFINQGVQLYLHFETYPLLALVGQAEFPTYLQQYEKRVTIPIIVPYGVAMVSNLALLVVRPSEVSLIGLIILLVVKVILAVRNVIPAYTRIQQNGQASPSDVQALLRSNGLRLGLSTLNSLVILYLLLDILASK